MTLIEQIRTYFPGLTEAQADRVRDLVEYQDNVDGGRDMRERYTQLVSAYKTYRQNGYSNIEAAVRAVSEQADADGERIDASNIQYYKDFDRNPQTAGTQPAETNWIKVGAIALVVFWILKKL